MQQSELIDLYKIKEEIKTSLEDLRKSGHAGLIVMAEDDLRSIEEQIEKILSK